MTGFGALAAGGVAWCEDGEVVDLSALGDVFAQPTLNALLAAGRAAWEEAVTAARAHDGPRVPESETKVRLPFEVADYVDFYSSLDHATHVGRLFRPDSDPLPKNWRWLPAGLM
jgi:fumarylacetoacetase